MATKETNFSSQSNPVFKKTKTAPLTSEEKKIIIDKGTEAPFTGKFNDHKIAGVYTCRQCGAFLYRSESKFDSGCGWPSFDDSVLGAVKETLDKDGIRTEILCNRCGAHLGHIFRGEELTSKNTRHCVNSISMDFINAEDFDKNKNSELDSENEKIGKIILGGGCFWCIEATIKMIPGVTQVLPGYAGGITENPNYEEVSSGDTGHAEVIQVLYDKTVVSLEKILEIFFASHDPTTLNRQGNDVGTQYRSVIYTTDSDELEIVKNFINKIQNDYLKPVVTELDFGKKFFPAEDYHRDYFANNPTKKYCELVIAPKLEKIKKIL